MHVDLGRSHLARHAGLPARLRHQFRPAKIDVRRPAAVVIIDRTNRARNYRDPEDRHAGVGRLRLRKDRRHAGKEKESGFHMFQFEPPLVMSNTRAFVRRITPATVCYN